MRFILPTQHAPVQCVNIGNIALKPYKRIKYRIGFGEIYLDSMSVECRVHNWTSINDWLAFHAVIFDDIHALDWYEGINFSLESSLDIVGDCANLVDYENISKNIYWTREHKSRLMYAELYDQYVHKPEKDIALIKSYLSSNNRDTYKSLERVIRDTSFWRLTTLYSIVEVIIGKPTSCTSSPPCEKCSTVKKKHTIAQKDWFAMRLNEIVRDSKIAKDYFSVIWLIREKIRHDTVHESAISDAHFVIQNDRVVTYDMQKIEKEWKDNYIALESLEVSMRSITRLLLLDSIFKIAFFPELGALKTTRIG